MNNDFRQNMNSFFDVLRLHHDDVDGVVDGTLKALKTIAALENYSEATIAMVTKRAEAIREAVKNNPLH